MAGGRYSPLATLISSDGPELADALRALRALFAGMFVAQSALALLTAALVLLLAGSGPSGGRPLGYVLVSLSVGQWLLGSLLPGVGTRSGTRASFLAATLLAAVLLASTSWFLALGIATGQPPLILALLAMTVFTAYALGFMQATRFARRLVASARAQASEEYVGAGPERGVHEPGAGERGGPR